MDALSREDICRARAQEALECCAFAYAARARCAWLDLARAWEAAAADPALVLDAIHADAAMSGWLD